MDNFKTGIKVYTDADGHLHYDFTLDKEHVSMMKQGVGWDEELQQGWDAIKPMPDEDFFKKSFVLTLLLRQLYNATPAAAPEDASNGNV